MTTSGYHVLVISSASIGIVNLPSYLTAFKQRGWDVKCILTPGASRLLNPETVAAFADTFVESRSWGSTVARVPHIDLTTWANILVVLPATANIIGQIANGIAPTLATTAILSTTRPVLIYPNVPDSTIENKAFNRNLQMLSDDGYFVYSQSELGYSVAANQYTEGRGIPSPDVVVTHITETLERR